VTFADRIGNAQRGIGPLHLAGMFPGSATPEEWITVNSETGPNGPAKVSYPLLNPRDDRQTPHARAAMRKESEEATRGVGHT